MTGTQAREVSILDNTGKPVLPASERVSSAREGQARPKVPLLAKVGYFVALELSAAWD